MHLYFKHCEIFDDKHRNSNQRCNIGSEDCLLNNIQSYCAPVARLVLCDEFPHPSGLRQYQCVVERHEIFINTGTRFLSLLSAVLNELIDIKQIIICVINNR